MEPSPVLVVNAGSSSIKFAAHEAGRRVLAGKLDRIGRPGASLSFAREGAAETVSGIPESDLPALHWLLDWLEGQSEFKDVRAVGHRVAHGMDRAGPEMVTQELLSELHGFVSYDPDHMPRELELIELFRQRFPGLPQIACFDTSFHRGLPRMAQILPIPRAYEKKRVRRYGFHGLSYAYLLEELERAAGSAAARGRVILAHLGSGASMAAVRGMHSIDTTMGFTPAGGMPMSTRSGDLDPGVTWYLLWSENMTPKQFSVLINHRSGLLGIAETGSDMRDLLARQAGDARAAEAVEFFCYSARKWIGAFAAVLEGLDTVVFSGGIGENSPEIRSRICAGLGFLGLELEQSRNAGAAPVISSDRSRVAVRVIPTDEESMIAREALRLLEYRQAA